jgi:hypothetical protein
MCPSQSERDREEEFLLRVEDERLRLGESGFVCYREFIPKLSASYRRGLESLRMINRRISGEAELTWEDIIDDARAKGDCTNLVPEDGG